MGRVFLQIGLLQRLIFVLILPLFLPLAVAISQENKTLTIGYDGSFPPFSHRNIAGKLSGFDIELSRLLCNRLKQKCDYKQFSWDNLIPALRSGKVDLVIATLPVTRQNQQLVALSNPYITLPSAVVASRKSLLSGLNKEDFNGARLGVLKSTSHREYLRVHLGQTQITTHEKPQDMFSNLASDNLDAIVGDAIMLDIWLKSSQGSQCCRLLGNLPIDIEINGEGFAIGILQGQAKLLTRLNNALEKLRTNGKLAEIRRLHLPFIQ